MKVENPRHPHYCVIYRIEGETPYSDGEKIVIYDGVCRSYPGYRPTEPDGVAKEIFALSLPVVYALSASNEMRLREGDFIEIQDRLGRFKGVIKRIMAGNLGTTIHWEDVKR